jgi:uncharacterized protein with FMN-binding domain
MRVRAALLSVLGSAAVLAAGWGVGHRSEPAAEPAPAAEAPSASSPSGAATAAASPASRSGTVTGTTAQTPYGPVQVAVVIANGRITDVKALRLTDHGGRSVAISAAAAPQLRAEALRAQSARIDTVSGATYTSDGYRTSLQSALDRAGR